MGTTPTVAGQRVAAWDGLRGIAVLAVLAYHLRAPWMQGGFLGVSLFFTLSGFLIAGLLTDELARSERIDFTRFWTRRFKRLLPASIACIALVVSLSELFSDSQQTRLRGDMAGVLGYVANWRFLATDVVYGGADPNPSPLRHAWSLAIEEQFYLLLPLVAAAAWFLWKRRGLVIVLVAALAASLVAGIVVGGNPSTAYFRTDVRMAEILIGALGALLVRSRAGAAVSRGCGAAAPIVLVALVAAWMNATETSGFLPRGGFALHALGSVVVVIGAAQAGWYSRALAWAPLAGVGIISYGLYLYHWPLFLVLTPGRLGTSTAVANALALTTAFAAAFVSWHLLERPIQRWVPTGRRRPLALAPLVSVMALAVAALALPRVATDAAIGLPSVADDEILVVGMVSEPPGRTTVAPAAAASSPTRAPAVRPTTSAATVPPPPTEAPSSPIWTPPLGTFEDLGRPPRILIVGDSVAWSLSSSAVPGSPVHGLAKWSQDTGIAQIASSAALACGISTLTKGRWVADIQYEPLDRCDWRRHAPATVTAVRPDVVLLLTGLWEITDRRVPGDDRWRAIGDPMVDTGLEQSLRDWIALHQGLGVEVVLALPPDIALCTHFDRTGPCPYPEDDPARMEAWRTIERRVAADMDVTVFDFPALLAEHGLAEPSHRQDGLHWSPEQADRDAGWLGPIVADAAVRLLSGRFLSGRPDCVPGSASCRAQ